jgi:hypothetical protein
VRPGRSVLFALVVVATAACRHSEAPAPAPSAAPPAPSAPSVASADPGRLPEDPVLGKQSEAQWREHLDEEEHERQALFDRQRLREHRALVKLIAATRARYDAAKTEAAVAKVRADMPRTTAEIQKRVTEIDHWGNNSRLLPDYEALSASLSESYPAAKTAALKGDEKPLEHERADFDARMQKIAAWLKEAAETKGEGEARESARERSESEGHGEERR